MIVELIYFPWSVLDMLQSTSKSSRRHLPQCGFSEILMIQVFKYLNRGWLYQFAFNEDTTGYKIKSNNVVVVAASFFWQYACTVIDESIGYLRKRFLPEGIFGNLPDNFPFIITSTEPVYSFQYLISRMSGDPIAADGESAMGTNDFLPPIIILTSTQISDTTNRQPLILARPTNLQRWLSMAMAIKLDRFWSQILFYKYCNKNDYKI